VDDLELEVEVELSTVEVAIVIADLLAQADVLAREDHMHFLRFVPVDPAHALQTQIIFSDPRGHIRMHRAENRAIKADFWLLHQ
jgi:hypothetical protein